MLKQNPYSFWPPPCQISGTNRYSRVSGTAAMAYGHPLLALGAEVYRTESSRSRGKP